MPNDAAEYAKLLLGEVSYNGIYYTITTYFKPAY
jgi:hypothetical protein